MNKFKNIIGFAIVLILFLSSCTGEEFDNSSEEEIKVIPEMTTTSRTANNLISRTRSSDDNGFENEEGWGDDCGRTLYPFSLVDNEGRTYEISNEDDLIDIFENFADSVTQTYIIDYLYPINVLNSLGETISINSADELYDLYITCIPEDGWGSGYFPAYYINEDNSCLEAVFPFELQDLDGNRVTVNNEDDLSKLIEEEELFFAFPLDLLMDGSLISVNNDEELFDALLSCNPYGDLDSIGWIGGDGFEYVGCFKIEFPISVLLTDGSTKQVDNHEDFCAILLQGNFEDYSYPITLIREDGETVVVNSQEEFEEALNQCYGLFIDEEAIIPLFLALSQPLDPNDLSTACYDIVFPFSTSTEPSGEGDIITFNNLEEVINYYENANIEILLYPIYPLNIMVNPDKEAVSINSLDEFIELTTRCFE